MYMKKFIVCLVVFLSFSFMFNSCTKDESFFQESFIIGKWVSGTLHYNYLANYTGTTWDTSDDVTEAEGQAFTWSLSKSELTHIYIMEIGGNVPKVYTVTELTATSLKYKDAFGTSYSFTR